MDKEKTVSLYIHIPFCASKCDYCDFTSFAISNDSKTLFTNYFSALDHELDFLNKKYLHSPHQLTSLYIGGGTPSVVPFKFYKPILQKIFDRFNPPEEFTCEVNSSSVTDYFLRGLKEYGCTRISMGLQSPNGDTLKKVNRFQTVYQFVQAYEHIKSLLFQVNIDLICGLPESLQTWREQCGDYMEKLSPEHCSVYILEVEKDTVLGEKYRKDHIALPSFEYTTETFQQMIWRLSQRGYRQYEISNFSLAGYESIHNHCYWESKNYLGIGVSAGGFFDKERYVNTHDLRKYISSTFEKEGHYDYYTVNTPEDNLREALFMGLRLKNGINVERLKGQFPN